MRESLHTVFLVLGWSPWTPACWPGAVSLSHTPGPGGNPFKFQLYHFLAVWLEQMMQPLCLDVHICEKEISHSGHLTEMLGGLMSYYGECQVLPRVSGMEPTGLVLMVTGIDAHTMCWQRHDGLGKFQT